MICMPTILKRRTCQQPVNSKNSLTSAQTGSFFIRGSISNFAAIDEVCKDMFVRKVVGSNSHEPSCGSQLGGTKTKMLAAVL